MLDPAIKRNQVAVPRNHDMIMRRAERGASVVRLDPQRTRLTIDRQAALAFGSMRHVGPDLPVAAVYASMIG